MSKPINKMKEKLMKTINLSTVLAAAAVCAVTVTTAQAQTSRFDALADLVARELGWSPAFLAHEVARTRELLAARHGVCFPARSLNSQLSTLN